MSKSKNGTINTLHIVGRLGRSEESSPKFTIAGKGFEHISLGAGNVTQTPQSEVLVGVGLREENLFLEGVALGAIVEWTECVARAKNNFMRSCSIRVVEQPVPAAGTNNE